MGKLTVFGVSLGLLASLASVQSAQAAEYNYSRYCDTLRYSAKNYSPDSEGYKSLMNENQQLCTEPASNTAYWTQDYEGPVNPFLKRAPEVAATDLSVGEIEKQAKQNVGNAEAAFANCHDVASKAAVSCDSSLASAQKTYMSDYNRIASLANGNSASVNQACGSISSFENTARSNLSSSVDSCQQLRSNCRLACENADSAYREMRGQVQLSDTAKRFRNDGMTSCGNIERQVSTAQNEVAAKATDLNNACQDGKKRLQAEKEDNQKKNEEEKKQAKADAQRNNQLGQALASLGNAFANQAPSNIPYGAVDSSSYSMPTNYSGSGSGLGNISNGNSSGSTAVTTPGGDMLMDGLTDGPDKGYQKSRMGQNPQRGGGGGGGVSAGGGGGGAAAAAKRRGGSGRSSKLDTDIFRGQQSGATNGSQARSGGGYPEAKIGSGGRVAGNNGRLSPQMVNLQRFLPTWAGRRDLASSQASGPDGITGPHSDNFKKVRAHYDRTILDIGN